MVLPVLHSNKKRVGIENPNASLTVQLVGDLHYGAVTEARPALITTDTPITPLACIQTGDITDTAEAGQDTLALAFLAALPSTAYTVCGGHDIWQDGRTVAQWATAYSMAGQNYVVDLGIAVLIAIAPDDFSAGPELSQTTLDYLDTQLGATAKKCIVACHVPPYNSVITNDSANYYDSLQTNFFSEDIAKLWAVLAAHDNAVVFTCGHTHSRYTDVGFVKTVQCGTHYMTIINNGSPYYTNKTTGEDLTEVAPTNYLTIDTNSLQVRTRDHRSARWLKQWNIDLETGLTEVSPSTYDEFTTAATAGTKIRASEPGPGGLDILDSNSIISVGSGVLDIDGTPVSGEGLFAQAPVLRFAGRAMKFDIPTRTTMGVSHYLGLSIARRSAQVDYGFRSVTTTQISPYTRVGTLGFSDTVGGNVWTILAVMRSTGGFLLFRDSGDTANQYKLAFVYNAHSDPEYASIRLNGADVDFTIDNLEVSDLGGNFATDYGICTDYAATTTNGETFSHTGDGIVEHTITAATGVTQEIMFRRTDDDNTWICRMDQGGSTLKLISKASGVETERASAAYTWTDGTKYRVMIWHVANTTRAFVSEPGSDEAYIAGSSINLFATVAGVKVSHAGENLATYPRVVTIS